MDDETELFQQFAPRIRAYGLRHLRSAAAADDLVQQVLIVVIEAKRAGKIREEDKLASFVLGTCRLVSQTARVTERRRERLLERFADRDATTEQPARLDLDRLRACLAKLGDRERTIVALTYVADYDGDTIAAQLGMTPGNVRVVRHRAMTHLHECVMGT